MTDAKLQQAEWYYQMAAQEADERRVKRNQAVRQALEEGWTHKQIADATGLTRGRIGQIALQD